MKEWAVDVELFRRSITIDFVCKQGWDVDIEWSFSEDKKDRSGGCNDRRLKLIGVERNVVRICTD